MTYKWQKVATNWTNTGNKYAVLVGIDGGAAAAASNVLSVKDSVGTVLDSFQQTAFGTAATEEFLGLPRKMLVPPNGSVNSATSVSAQVIICDSEGPLGDESLAAALRIL